MKITALAALLTGIVTLTMMYAQTVSTDATQGHRVAHPAGTMLAINFAHADHVGQSCISCHHDYVDDTGIGMCLDCHKTDPQVAHLMEEQFHDLCRGCHLDEQLADNEHGPTRRCIACHIADDQP